MKKLLIGLANLIVVLIVVFIFIIPFWDVSNLLKTSLNGRETELEQLQARIDKVNYLKKEYQSMEDEVQKVFLALPREEDIPNLLIQFEALASDNGLILDSISFGQLKPSGSQQQSAGIVAGDDSFRPPVQQIQSSQTRTQSSFLRNLSVDVSLSGRYDNFKKYLDSLTNNIRSMSVQSISFSPPKSLGEKRSPTDTFVFNLSVNVNYQ